MSWRGYKRCPRCGRWGCKLVDPADLRVCCPECGHTWRSRAVSAARAALLRLHDAADAYRADQAYAPHPHIGGGEA